MRIIRYTLLIVTTLYWLMILVLTHLPRPPHVPVHIGDKSQHLIAYAVLGSLLYLTFWACRPGLRRSWLYVMAIVLAYGAVDEWTQPLTGRSSEIYDFFADFAGATVAVGLLSVARLWAIANRSRTR